MTPSGVGKSGSPAPKSTTSFPSRRNRSASAATFIVDDTLIVEVLQKMVKQRRESIEMFVKGGRQELADGEAAEVAVIETFLPTQMDEAATAAAIAEREHVATGE